MRPQNHEVLVSGFAIFSDKLCIMHINIKNEEPYQILCNKSTHRLSSSPIEIKNQSYDKLLEELECAHNK